METKFNLRDFINKKVQLDLVDKVTCEVYAADNPRTCLIAVYDNRQRKSMQGSWLCNQDEACLILADIQKKYGRESI